MDCGAASAGINSFPAVDGDTLLVGSAAAGFAKKPKFQPSPIRTHKPPQGEPS
jgi:hypothetical protein